MVTIKQIGLPPQGAHWSYGADYMRRIGKSAARALCGMYPLPDIGYETIVAVKPAACGFKSRLVVQNISGDYYLASTDAKVNDWPNVFGVTVK